MQSLHEIYVDLVRLLAATERLLLIGEPAAEDGKWEHWARFCQVLYCTVLYFCLYCLCSLMWLLDTE